MSFRASLEIPGPDWRNSDQGRIPPRPFRWSPFRLERGRSGWGEEDRTDRSPVTPVLLFFLVVFCGITGLPSEDCAQTKALFPAPACQRIVSLAPSITETLFALGLGGRVVGVTDDCFFPAEVKGLATVGNYYRPNTEAVVRLRPDLVVLLTQHLALGQGLSRLAIPVLTVDHDRVDGILSGILRIGATCDCHAAAEKLAAELHTRIERVRQGTRDLPRPRVMVTIGRNMGSEGLGNIYVAGRQTFIHELIELSGGRNVCGRDSLIIYPKVSREGVLALDPEIIIDLVPDLAKLGLSEEAIQTQWQELSSVSAVKHKRLYVFGDEYVVSPGPRFVLTLERMAGVIHPKSCPPARKQ